MIEKDVLENVNIFITFFFRVIDFSTIQCSGALDSAPEHIFFSGKFFLAPEQLLCSAPEKFFFRVINFSTIQCSGALDTAPEHIFFSGKKNFAPEQLLCSAPEQFIPWRSRGRSASGVSPSFSGPRPASCQLVLLLVPECCPWSSNRWSWTKMVGV